MWASLLPLIRGHQHLDADHSKSERQRRPSRYKRPAHFKAASRQMIARMKRARKTAQERDRPDHSSNEKSVAQSTRTIARFTIALAIVGCLTAWIAFRQWQEMQSGGADTHALAKAAEAQAEATKTQLVVMKGQLDAMREDQRPWIRLDASLASDLTYDFSGDARILISYSVENTGHSPAIDVYVDEDTAVILGVPIAAQKAVSERQKRRGFAFSGVMGITLFPGQKHIIYKNIPIALSSIKAYQAKMESDFRHPMDTTYIPFIVGCVDYKFAFSDDHHQTGFIFDIRKQSPNGPLVLDLKDGNVSKDRLWLIPNIVGVPPD